MIKTISFIFITSFLCTSCMPHNKPVANIEYSGVTSIEKTFSSSQENGEPIRAKEYTMLFTSDIELLELFKKDDGDNPLVWARLVCALDNDVNFSVEHRMQRYIHGTVEPDTQKIEPVTNFKYLSKFNFFETTDNGSSESYIDKEHLNYLLSKRTLIPCKVVMTVYLSSPYYSNTVNIPTKNLLREINSGH